MAIIDSASYSAATGQTFAGAAATAIAAHCAAVDAALKRVMYPFSPEPVTVTDHIFDAPLGNELLLPVVPVRSITSIYLHWGANGDPAVFTSDDLLDPYSDYFMVLDRPADAYSRSGRVQRRGSSCWGYEGVRPLNRLGMRYDPNRGGIKATWEAGLDSVPEDIAEAARLAVSLLYNRRKTGMPLASESWNGYSYSNAGPFTALAAIATPDVAALLSDYVDPVRFGSL